MGMVDPKETTGRPNKIDFVEHLYRFDVKFTDEQIESMVFSAYASEVSRRTLAVWKVQLRKKGIVIPDRRSKE